LIGRRLTGRRDVLAAGAAFAGTAFAPVSPVTTGFFPVPGFEQISQPTSMGFAVLRNGSRIGTHRIDFREADGVVTATIAVEIVVRFGPITLFRYGHNAREIWRDGQFESLVSETNDDGKPIRAKIARTAEGVVVEVQSKQRVVMAAETIPLTHWNIQCMDRPLVNPQDGTPIMSQVVQRGEESVPMPDGKMVTARHYSLVGKVAIDDWYDGSSVWVALRTKAVDGSMIDYRRVV
jgi:hypothetical protein